MISNCGCDERGLASGGLAGDQTGSEWVLVPWYNFPWNCVLHHPNANVRSWIAKLAIEAANNDNIGYDQAERHTFWDRLTECGYRPANIKVKCESDCSAGVAAIVKAVGYILNDEKLKNVSSYSYTGNLRERLAAAGFEVRTGTKYLTTDDYASAGDVYLNEGHHTTINCNDGKYAGGTTKANYVLKTRTIGNSKKGHDVYVLQCILKARTFYTGKVDAHFGDLTESAVRRYQKKVGLKVDGIVGFDTWSSLLSLEYLGKDGDYFTWDVKKTQKGTDHTDSTILIQEMLIIKKFYKGNIDGSFQKKTVSAVKSFQKKYKLTVDGICGAVTTQKIMTPTGQL